jgi:hypothetical protein
MATHLVIFATEEFSHSRALCISSALLHGVTQTHPCDPGALPPDTLRRCEGRRGFGWWQWKPAVIQLAMRGCEDGSILIYSDVGIEFINNVSYIIDRMDQDVFLFGNNWEHAHWCKRDVVEHIWPYRDDGWWGEWENEKAWSRFGKQCQASVIFFRVSDYSRKFVAEWLKWCLFEGGRLIDDSPSRAPNHPEFRENRHDQAILTTLGYREAIKLHYWPAMYNRGGSPEFIYEKLPRYADDTYPVLFSHHRRRNHEW